MFLVACATPPPPLVDHTDAAARLRAERARAANDFERALITEELATVELERAREAHTVFAYRRFIEEFPIGREATTARKLLESLRFDEATATNTRLGWQSFLAEHPDGAHAADARERLGTLIADEVSQTLDLGGVREVIARFPDHPRREELVRLEDRLAFEQAMEAGLVEINAYLSAHPLGAFRAQALDRKEALEHDEILASRDLDRARKRADTDPSGASQLLVDELLFLDAQGALDVDALRALANDAVEPVRSRARGVVDGLGRPALASSTWAAIEQARASHGIRSLDEVREVLRSGDPLERVAALGEATEYASWEAADLVLGAVDSRYVDVRLAAVEELARLKGSMPEASWRAFVGSREEEALFDALTASPWRRVAALRDADGRGALAVAAWREVLRYDPDDLAANARVLSLSQAAGDRLSTGGAARELASTAALFGDGRWLTPPDPTAPAIQRRDGPGTIVGAPAEVTVLRQLCAALELTKTARAALDTLRQGTLAAEMQLYALAITDADEAIARMVARRAEQEREVARRGYPPCGTDAGRDKLDRARKERVQAIEALGKTGDVRLLPFLERVAWTPSQAVAAAARQAIRSIESSRPLDVR